MSSEAVLRLLKAEEMEDAVRLADSIFRQGDKVSMGHSLPKVFSKSLRQSIGCFVGGRLVSFAGMVPSSIRIGKATLSVYSYGAVCTHPDFRGQGHAGRILQFAKEHAGRSGASLLLVSGDRSLYMEAGCSRFGCVNHYRLVPGQAPVRVPETEAGMASGSEPENAPPSGAEANSSLRCRPADETDWFRLHEVASAQPVGFERSLWDLADLLRAEAVASIRQLRHRTWLAERDGVPVAYCVAAVRGTREETEASDEAEVRDEAKTSDKAEETEKTGKPREAGERAGLVVDWAGEPAAVVSLLGRMGSGLGLDSLELTIGRHERELAELLRPALVETGCNQGTLLIVDELRLFRQLAPYWEAAGYREGDIPKLAEADAGKVSIAFGAAEPPLTLRREELAGWLFGAGDSSGRYSSRLQEDSREDARGCRGLPIPLPYTKGLNFV